MNTKTRQALQVTLPIVYIFAAVFLFRDHVRDFYLLSVGLIVIEILIARKQRYDMHRLLGLALIVLASVGLAAASILTIEKIELLKDPQHVTSCSVSPIVACSPIIASPQATAFDHIPNPVFGIFGFGAVLTAGMTLIAGARKLARAWWLTLMAGVLFGVGFCIWLIHEGVYEIGALCLYCMSVWMVTFSIFWFTLDALVRQKHVSLGKKLDVLVVKQRDTLIAASIGVVILLLYFRWSDYWNSLF